MTDAKKLEAAIYAALDSPVLPEGTQVIRAEGWYQVVTPGLKEASSNEVMLSTVRVGDVERRISDAFEIYRKESLPFKWAIGPMSAPEIESRIASKASASWGFCGMSINSTAVLPKATANVDVELVDQRNFPDFLEVNLRGWDLRQFLAQTKTKLQRMIDHPQYRCFIARSGDKVIGSAATVLKEGYGYLVGAVVLEEYRGCGAYRALIQARLKDLHGMAYPFAVTQARNATSAPILTKLGFETLYQAKIYRFDP